MNTTYVNARRPLRGLQLALSGLLLGPCLLGATGCDYLKQKADEKLQEELKKDSKKNGDDDDDDKASANGSAKAGAPDGTVWVAARGATTKLVRAKIDVGGLSGLSIMAPEGAEVKASLGGRGADVQKLSAGFAVWILEDSSVTLPLIKEAASAKYGKDSKVQHEDANSVIVGGKSALGDEFYAYQGFFKAPNGKLYRCETESSQAGSTKAHAEAIDKLCESLEIDGKSIGSGGGAAAPAEKVAESEAQKTEPEKAASPGGTKPTAAETKPVSAPGKTSPAPTQTTPPAATQPAPTAKPTVQTPPPPPPKKERTRK